MMEEPYDTLPPIEDHDDAEWRRAGSADAMHEATVRAEQGQETFDEFLDRTEEDGGKARRKRTRELIANEGFKLAVFQGARSAAIDAFMRAGLTIKGAIVAVDRADRER